MNKIDDSPKEALNAFLLEIDKDYYEWYEKNVKQLRLWWRLSEYVQIGSSFVTAILAAIATEEWFTSFGPFRIALILLPVFGAACTVAAAKSHLHERYQLREDGRRSIQNAFNSGRQRYAEASTPAEYAEIHAQLVKQLNEIEAQQSAGFFSFVLGKAKSDALERLPV